MKLLERLWILAGHGVPEGALSAEMMRRLRVLTLVSFAVICIGLPFIVQYLLLGVPLMSFAVLATVIVGLVNVVMVRRTLDVTLAGWIGTASLFALILLSNWCSGGFYDPNFGWLYVIPIVASLMINPRAGWAFAGAVAIATLLFWLAPTFGVTVPNYIPEEMHALQSLFNRLSAIVGIAVVLGAIASQHRFVFSLLENRNDELRREIKERELMQARLMRSERLASMGSLAAGVAHEINNPLSYVIGNLHLAREELDRLKMEMPHDAFKEVRAMLFEASEGADRVKTLMRDLKTFSRAGDEQREAFDVKTAVDAAVKLTRNEIRHRAGLTVKCPPGLLAFGAEGRLFQVLVNLLTNACHAIEPGHAFENMITVMARRENERLIIDVTDSGHGVPQEHRERIFEPFFTTKAQNVGTGLGLSICRNIVEQMGGTIELLSSEGVGTSFTIELPAFDGTLPKPVATADIELSSALRILVIDDESPILRMVRSSLGDAVVTTVTNGQAALQLCGQRDFDLILCDLMMPEMTGIDVHRALAENHPEAAARLIFMTGGIFTPEVKAYLDSHHGPLLEKPFEPDKLRRMVVEALRDRERPDHTFEARSPQINGDLGL